MSLASLAAPRVQDLFSEFSEAVVLADLEQRITYANPAALELFGYTLEALIGQCSSTLCVETDGMQTRAQRMNYLRADGRAFLGNTLAGPIRNHFGENAGSMMVIQVASVAEQTVAVLQRVHQITTNAELEHEERLQALLEVGRTHFELPLAIQSRVEGETYTVESCVDPGQALKPGASFPLGSTYCVHTLEAQGPTGFHHAGQSEIREHPCYQGFGLESYLGCPILVEGQVYGTLNFSREESSRPFSPDDHALVQLLAHWVGHTITQGRVSERLHELATTDPLTGMLNRRAFGESLAEAVVEARREGQALAVLALDLDHFKRINDTFGHAVGDSVLCAVAEVMSRLARPGDLIARVGGEEFVVVLAGGTIAEAVSHGYALLGAFSRIRIPSAPKLGQVSASFGAATLQGDEDANSLLCRADKAMYQAKVGGRACLRLAA